MKKEECPASNCLIQPKITSNLRVLELLVFRPTLHMIYRQSLFNADTAYGALFTLLTTSAENALKNNEFDESNQRKLYTPGNNVLRGCQWVHEEGTCKERDAGMEAGPY